MTKARPIIGWRVRYWEPSGRQRTGTVMGVSDDAMEVRWAYGEHQGIDTVLLRWDWVKL